VREYPEGGRELKIQAMVFKLLHRKAVPLPCKQERNKKLSSTIL